MERQLKATGLFFGLVFAVGTVLNVVTGMAKGKPPLVVMAEWDFMVMVAFTLILFLSAYLRSLAWVQPLVILLLSAMNIFQSRDSFYGLGLFVTALLLLIRLGFFERHRAMKIALAFAYLIAVEVVSALVKKELITYALTPVFFILVFLLVLYLAFQEKIMVYLKEPKARISLGEKGLSEAEKSYVLALAKGKNVKEIALDYEVAESTIRNTISRAYQKLGVADKAAFATLVERFEIVG